MKTAGLCEYALDRLPTRCADDNDRVPWLQHVQRLVVRQCHGPGTVLGSARSRCATPQ